MNFEERLGFLIKDRKKTPWGKSLGFTSPSITAMFNGHIPGPEFLHAIRRAENVNLNWLLTGEGAPYIADYFHSGQALYQHLAVMLGSEPWQVYVCSHHTHACFVLTQPGQYEFKGKWVDYTIIHILSGPSDEALTDLLQIYSTEVKKVFVVDHLAPVVPQIMRGDIGTYELLHKENPILTPLPLNPDISEVEFSASARGERAIDISIMRAVVKLVDECEDKLNFDLTSTQRARVITAVYRQAERLDLDERDIQNAVETSLEVLTD